MTRTIHQKCQEKIRALENEIERLKKLSYYDELTKLYNRRGFFEMMEGFVETVEREFSSAGKRRKLSLGNLSIIFADLNRLKQANDKYGHRCGDELIKTFAEVLIQNVRNIDVVCRWSGDEFVIGLIGANKNDAEVVVEKIKKILEDKILALCEVESLPLSASFGVAAVYDETRKPKLIVDLNRLIAEADKKMYQEKIRMKEERQD